MKAFSENIDALETKLTIFIQKWKEINNQNKILIERNKQLEEEMKRMNLDNTELSNKNSLTGDSKSAFDPTYIINAIDQYVHQIDGCIEKINIELDGR